VKQQGWQVLCSMGFVEPGAAAVRGNDVMICLLAVMLDSLCSLNFDCGLFSQSCMSTGESSRLSTWCLDEEEL
jgi:hypothetical protein